MSHETPHLPRARAHPTIDTQLATSRQSSLQPAQTQTPAGRFAMAGGLTQQTMNRITVLTVDASGNMTAIVANLEHVECVAEYAAKKGRRVAGIRTCIDESSVYHADLSSPFLEDAPHPHSLSV